MTDLADIQAPANALSYPSAEHRDDRDHRDARIIALVLAGATVRNIAAQVGIAKSQAAAIICRGLGRRVGARGENLAQLVALEADHLHEAVWVRALAGDPDALDDTLLKIHDHRARSRRSRSEHRPGHRVPDRPPRG